MTEALPPRWKSDRWLLELASLLWLVVPFQVFAAGWLRPWVAVPAIALSAAGVWRSLPRVARGPAASTDALPASRDWTRIATYSLAALLVLLFVSYSGTGGYAFQFGGHWRNNAFIRDLMLHPWPLGFEDVGSRGEPGVLAFYIANALGPAAFAKAFGWSSAFHAQFVWTGIGVFLAIGWFLRVVGDRAPQWVLLFFLFGGLDWIGYRALIGPYPGPRVELDLWTVFLAQRTPEMAGVFWIFPSNPTLLFNSPHHVLCSWIVLGMLLDDALHRGTSRRVGFLVAFALLWSAFSFVGLAPFVLASLWWTRGRGMWSFENVVAGVTVLGLSALYVGSNNGEYVSGPLWRFQSLGETGWRLAVVCVLEFGVYAALLPLVERRRSGIGHPLWLGVVVATLLALPWLRVGDNNDFTTKAAVPALLVLQMAVAHALAGRPWRRPLAAVGLIAVLVVGSASSLLLLARSVRLGIAFRVPPIEEVTPSNELERCSRGGQLFSDGDDFFWRVLARPVVLQPNVPPEPTWKRRGPIGQGCRPAR